MTFGLQVRGGWMGDVQVHIEGMYTLKILGKKALSRVTTAAMAPLDFERT